MTYYANGGTGEPEQQHVVGEDSVKLSDEQPTWPHHKFLGWSTMPNMDTADYQPGDVYEGGRSIILYGVWERSLDNVYVLPKNLTVIEDGAFKNSSADAFVVPASVTEIGDDVFDDVAIYGEPGSYAEIYAGRKGLLFIPA